MSEPEQRGDETAGVFRERFLRMLGHDLRNPLASILMNVRVLLKTGELDERQGRFASRIASSAEKMERMLRDLGDFARSRFGGGRVHAPVDCHLGVVCQKAVDAQKLLNPTRVIVVEADAGCQGHWDAERLGRAVTSMVDNALRHGSPDGPVRVLARDLGGEVAIEVNNRGDVIPASAHQHLFDPVRRGQAGDAGSGGLGLGLFITSEIALAHGGRASMTSTEAQGTTFSVILPKQALPPDHVA